MLLAYDHDRVVGMRMLLMHAIERLDGFAADRTIDGASLETGAALRRIADELRQPWMARVDGLIACTALLADDSHDPLDRVGTPSATGIVTIDDTGDLTTLTARVAARVQVDGVGDTDGAAERHDAALAALAALAASVPGDARGGAYPVVLEQMPPLAAALLLEHLPLDDRTLATVVDRLARRWRDGADPAAPRWTSWPDQRLAGVTTAGVVTALMRSRPDVLVAVATRTADRPDVFVGLATSTDDLTDLLHRATDPRRVDSATAGRVLVPLARWWRSPAYDLLAPPLAPGVDVGAALATVAPPWVRQFGSRADDWGWSADEGRAVLRELARDGDRFDRLVSALADEHRRALGSDLLDERGRLDVALFDDLYGTFAEVMLVTGDERVRNARIERAIAELIGDSATFLAGKRVPTSRHPALGFGMSMALDKVTPLTTDVLSHLGLAPPSVGRVEQHVAADQAMLSARLTVAAVGTVVAGFVAGGRLDPDVAARLPPLRQPEEAARRGECPATTAYGAARELVDALEQHLDPDDHELLVTVLFARANPESVALLCRDRR